MKNPHVLSIDFGTQSVRAVLFCANGNPVARSAIVLQEPQSEQPGWAEYDAEYLWSCLVQAASGLWSDNIQPDSVAAVTLTTMRGCVVSADARGRPLRPVILWSDQRRTERAPLLPVATRLLFSIAGVAGTVRHLQGEAEANWLASEEPDCWRKTDRFMLLSTWLNFRLTGQFRDSSASQVGYLPMNFRSGNWASGRSWKWKAMPSLRPDQLPELVPPGHKLGSLTASAAQAIGVSANTPVIAAAADKACEILGLGEIDGQASCLSLGTAATISIGSARYREPERLIPPYPAAVPGHWNLESQINRGFWLVKWFGQQFGSQEARQAQQQGVPIEVLLDQLLAQSPPGANGLLSQPHWSAGLRAPGPEARGALVGFDAGHTRADMYRSLIEGIIFGLRAGKEQIERRLGTRTKRALVAGGGSNSDTVLSLTADILNLPVTRSTVADVGALGAAINAFTGIGRYPGYKAAIAAMVHPGSSFEPDPLRAADYDRVFADCYLPLYRRLKPVYRQLLRT